MVFVGFSGIGSLVILVRLPAMQSKLGKPSWWHPGLFAECPELTGYQRSLPLKLLQFGKPQQIKITTQLLGKSACSGDWMRWKKKIWFLSPSWQRKAHSPEMILKLPEENWRYIGWCFLRHSTEKGRTAITIYRILLWIVLLTLQITKEFKKDNSWIRGEPWFSFMKTKTLG